MCLSMHVRVKQPIAVTERKMFMWKGYENRIISRCCFVFFEDGLTFICHLLGSFLWLFQSKPKHKEIEALKIPKSMNEGECEGEEDWRGERKLNRRQVKTENCFISGDLVPSFALFSRRAQSFLAANLKLLFRKLTARNEMHVRRRFETRAIAVLSIFLVAQKHLLDQRTSTSSLFILHKLLLLTMTTLTTLAQNFPEPHS